jgi:hypothetical protein
MLLKKTFLILHSINSLLKRYISYLTRDTDTLVAEFSIKLTGI